MDGAGQVKIFMILRKVLQLRMAGVFAVKIAVLSKKKNKMELYWFLKRSKYYQRISVKSLSSKAMIKLDPKFFVWGN